MSKLQYDKRHPGTTTGSSTRIGRQEVEGLVPILEAITRSAAVRMTRALDIGHDRPALQTFKDWAAAVRLLGAEPVGMWQVDFDNGLGYYRWEAANDGLLAWVPYDRGAEAEASWLQ